MDPQNTDEKNFGPIKYPGGKFWNHERPTKKIFETTYNTHERKFWTHEITTRKKVGNTKYPRGKFWAYEIPKRKKFRPTKCLRGKFGAHEIPTRKIFRPTIYLREKYATHEGTMAMMTHGPRNLTHL